MARRLITRRRDAAAGELAKGLAAHLRALTVPYLFVGSGLSIRYAQAEDWGGLLRTFATQTGRPYEYYFSGADGDLPQVASLLVEDFHELWWTDERFASSREANGHLATARDSALKIEVSGQLAAAAERLPDDGPLAEELGLLGEAVIDGIITTNFDQVLETVRPDLEVYCGQDELLFSDPQGIGEIYKIHGSCTQPNSLVLTGEDYALFGERNAYLVAKLLTVFVEHPVIFLGYSLTDRNVQQLLGDLARCLTPARLEDLRDRLIFVERDEDAEPSMTSTSVVVDGFSIPVLRVMVPDFKQVFAALGQLRAKIPARLVRHLRREIFELVRTSEPTGQLFVEELDPDARPSDVQVYAGIGAIAKLTTSYVGLERADLLNDVLEDRGYDASRMVLEALPRLHRRKTLIPAYKYLRGAGALDRDGSLKDAESVPSRVVQRVEGREELLTGLKSYAARAARALTDVASFGDLVAGRSPEDVLYYLPFMNEQLIDVDELRAFLIDSRDIFDENRQPAASQWARAVCLLDWLAYGRQ